MASMNARERTLWMRVQRRSAQLSPALRTELLAAYRTIRGTFSDAELARLIASGRWEQVVDGVLMDRAFMPVRKEIVTAVEQGLTSAVSALPKAGLVDGVVGVGFDVLNPRVVDAIRRLDDRAIKTLKADIREGVRVVVENGLRDGVAPRTIARDVKGMIGLAPNQREYIQNYRDELEAGSQAALDRQLRDRRYDARTARGAMTEVQIDRAVAAYEKRLLQFNATTNARTMAGDSLKLGQHLSWQDAVDNGMVDKGQVWKRWVGVMDDRERPEHVEMEGDTVAFDAAFSNGEYIPGESTFNCRCIIQYVVQPQGAGPPAGAAG
jgi:hypothetical protein